MPTIRKYCGNSAVLPNGYTDFDDRYSCLRKGFGVAKGKYGETQQCKLNYKLFIITIIILVLLLCGLTCWIVWTMYYDKIEN
jgi:hypothetical protein